MTEPSSSVPDPTALREGPLARFLRAGLYVGLGIFALLFMAVGLLYARLSIGPMSFDELGERVSVALSSRIGPGWKVNIRSAAIQLENGSPALRAAGLDIRNPEGELVLRAPFAILSVDGLALATGNIQPRSIEFRDLQLRASLNRDGSLSFVPNQETPGSDPSPQGSKSQNSAPFAEASVDPRTQPSPVSLAAESLFQLLAGPSGIVGALDRAHLTNARLTLVDADGRERAAFGRVDATFERPEAGVRQFDALLEGSRGAWHVRGEARIEEGDEFRARVDVENAPARDLLLLSGLSNLPATTDLKLSGQVQIGFSSGRLKQLTGTLESGRGIIQVHDKDTSPLLVDAFSLAASWNEDADALVVDKVELKSADTSVRLSGELIASRNATTWHASLKGSDATLSGASEKDPPVILKSIEARLSGDGGLRIEALSLRAPDLSVELSGLLFPSSDPNGLYLDVKGAGTPVRSALRLWPEAAAPPVRKFLIANLLGGTVDNIDLKVAMTGDDMERAIKDGPISEDALHIAFEISAGVLSGNQGLPPLSQATVSGTVTGTKAAVRAPSGRVEMPDKRALTASEGAFVVDNFWLKDAVARIGFRLQGGADAVGSLLRAPAIQEVASVDLNPASMKGQADLRVTIPLAVNNVPKFVDLPMSVAGTLRDISIEHVFGQDKLENANLALSYEHGTLSVKGEGKLAGSPAAIDVQQGGKSSNEASVSLVLDEAARTRRGINFGPQLIGPLAVKAILPLGNADKTGTRIDVDLAKAAVDGLVPGWTKAAGRPGRMTFILADGPTKNEILDFQLDSGPVQLRGSAVLSEDGALEKADLTTFKLSSGDDMKAQVEKINGIYKVTVRGNNGDSRPFTRSLSTQGTSAKASQRDKETRDLDLDLALNILTGHNDEVITSANLKASLRKDSIRQLDLKGKIGSQTVVAQTVSNAGGNPLITVQTQDAGAVLRFVDIYRRMVGGDLAVQFSTGDGPQTGFMTLRDFSLRNEPALRRIIPTQSQVVTGTDEKGKAQVVRLDVNEVDFTKARVDFTRVAGRVDFKDAAIWGQAIGFTLGGFLDYSRDRVDIAGTFVPAYGLNNAFAQVPLFGPLLGGGQYEGLFAVNFRILGQATAPNLTVNPLSAVAPGFLRKLFGTGGGGDTPTGSLPNQPPGGENLNR